MRRIILLGEGPLAYHVARQAIARGSRVTVVTRTPEAAELLARSLGIVALAADPTLPDTLAEIEVEHADVLVALGAEDQDNLLACCAASALFGVPRTVALVNDPEHVEVFEALGVGVVVSAAELLGAVIEQASAFHGILERVALAGTDVQITRVRITEDAPAVASPLSGLSLPEGALIAVVLRGNEVLIPRGNLRMEAQDEVLLVCRAAVQAQALALLLGSVP